MKSLKMFNLTTLALAALVLGFQSSAIADGFYFGAGAYVTEAELDNLDETDETLAFMVGYKLIDSNVFLLSAELGVYDLGDYSDNGTDVDADALTLAAVAGIPLGPFIELYGKAGIAEVSVEVNNDDFDGSEVFYGAGVALDFFDTIDIYIEYLEFDTEVDSSMIGAGIMLDLF